MKGIFSGDLQESMMLTLNKNIFTKYIFVYTHTHISYIIISFVIAWSMPLMFVHTAIPFKFLTSITHTHTHTHTHRHTQTHYDLYPSVDI